MRTCRQTKPHHTHILTIPPTPTPTSFVGSIDIEYSTQKLDKIPSLDSYIYPPANMEFLVFDLKVTNKGNKMITVNQFSWSLKANTNDNPNAFLTMDQNFYPIDSIPCVSAELNKDGFTSCKVKYEVPINYNQFKITYDGAFDTPVNWNYLGEK